ncbi:3-hydroxyacyl-CoA dehydrogenase [Bosea sp. BIWAKO-01]|uniref:3-hydroxyacyl-CoA dehydrogenase n=1 Tax=Bosea sp. BIWAKO-01 TaxID=506668 RepID=UPI0008538C28|nr:3-hydroxyacyl-CoA dehydrogenase [Bosea sp. BIWAKO-01]GAU81757.1 3-hydroxybutyryl-CoA dehydrogenase [Bosea sp. BIWAKO-01]
MTKIAIIGSGLIGRAWATIFASHGFDVALHDVAPGAAEAARAHISSNLEELAGHGLVEDPRGSLARIRVASGLADALSGADLVQENGPEAVDTKRALFAEMDTLAAPETILASSTSFIMASVFSETLPGRARCLVAHPVNPPHLVPIVELAPAPWTDPAVLARAKALYEQAGQVPIVLRKEKPGFVLNRLQAVLLAEAFRLVGEGVASAEDVDKTIRDGLGLRWSFMGPFETIELNAPGGIPDYCARYGASIEAMAAQAVGGDPFGAETVTKVMSEWPGTQSPERVKHLSDWRDTRLAALQAHKRSAARKPV